MYAQIIEFPSTGRHIIERPQPPRRCPNADSRSREWLEPHEVDALIKAVRREAGRMRERDVLMIRLAYEHGLRATELCKLRWDHIEFTKPERINITRLKKGVSDAHPLSGEAIRALKAWRRVQGERSAYVFTSLSARPSPAAAFIMSLRSPARLHAALSHTPAHAAALLRLQARQRR
jgi:type 1 fimbriae regulatory protein FimB/type 1 fimbriae regulatory protein FimE